MKKGRSYPQFYQQIACFVDSFKEIHSFSGCQCEYFCGVFCRVIVDNGDNCSESAI